MLNVEVLNCACSFYIYCCYFIFVAVSWALSIRFSVWLLGAVAAMVLVCFFSIHIFPTLAIAFSQCCYCTTNFSSFLFTSFNSVFSILRENYSTDGDIIVDMCVCRSFFSRSFFSFLLPRAPQPLASLIRSLLLSLYNVFTERLLVSVAHLHFIFIHLLSMFIFPARL